MDTPVPAGRPLRELLPWLVVCSLLGFGWVNSLRHEQRFRDRVEELHDELNDAIYHLDAEAERFEQDDWRDVVPDLRSAVDTVTRKNDALRRAVQGMEVPRVRPVLQTGVTALPTTAERGSVAAEAPADMNTRVMASRDRVFARYPWLADESSPLRRELDAYVEAALRDERRRDLFAQEDWPERIALEWGVSRGYLWPDGSVVAR